MGLRIKADTHEGACPWSMLLEQNPSSVSALRQLGRLRVELYYETLFWVPLRFLFASCKGIRNPGNFCLWNSESWVLESGMQLKKSGIPLTIKMRNPRSTGKESKIQYLESGIHVVEPRIQDGLGFPYKGRFLYWPQRMISFNSFQFQTEHLIV